MKTQFARLVWTFVYHSTWLFICFACPLASLVIWLYVHSACLYVQLHLYGLGPLSPLLLFYVYWAQLHLYGFKSTPSAFTFQCLLGSRSIRFASIFISPLGCFHLPVFIPTQSVWRLYSSFSRTAFIPPPTTPASLSDSRILSYSIVRYSSTLYIFKYDQFMSNFIKPDSKDPFLLLFFRRNEIFFCGWKISLLHWIWLYCWQRMETC